MGIRRERKLSLVRDLLRGRISKQEAARELNGSIRTIERYVRRFLEQGPEGLIDRRRGNNRKLTRGDERAIVGLKKQGPWRSARKIRDMLRLGVDAKTVWRVEVKRGVQHLNYERVKPITRFVAEAPNDLWQSDIMGKVNFPKLGTMYLIATIDDHSRFILSGKWFTKQSKINVFRVWYHALCRYGLPKAMLQDKGSQYRAHRGEADYQHYAKVLGIGLIYALRAQTKGKIERFWRFVQQDFVRENLDVGSVEELNRRFFRWQNWFNHQFKSNAMGMNGRTPAQAYRPSSRRKPTGELRTMLVIEERRKVMRDSTISLYGHHYRVPPGYIGCRIWVKIVGENVIFQAMNKTIWKQKLQL